ncbi:MAG: 1,3-beta-galactosyl-N-acetylhexosamine phosphorylase [Lachnospiraceae bacterium]|nr:1,3-beta-galactosyl-N-acetylhexosamine phosphorylase [Lachnospiraceae bacterium]
METTNKKGGFTLPGESGYEKLTLEMAEKWGADVIRDSDGTVLSDDILNAGYDIYSTICIIRDHNEWARNNLDKLQQTFLVTQPKVATEESLTFHLMDDFYPDQFRVNASSASQKYWQVYDRTSGTEVNPRFWAYDAESGNLTVSHFIPWHRYTVSFLAYRIWEEISMYNHTTNNWDKEHLMQIDPVYPETQEYLKQWLTTWCEEHPATNVVRFTSMFYNFVWIWGSDPRNHQLFSDWGSYDFTVSPRMLDNFAETYGYRLTAEDFINKGDLHVTHMPPTKTQLDYMDFINQFVVRFGKELVSIVHKYGKKAYVFYDDSWIGVEPNGKRFTEFGFDGLIKCVFSGYEARLCANAKVDTHELRLHPYLFPVGLGGLPTFSAGGNPTLDAKQYWNHVRRALLRAKIDRIGLGGYLHLVEGYPDFCNYIADIADEFRTIRSLHEAGGPTVLPIKVAVLHAWGSLRAWTLSGHFHETYMHDLIHINEALSGFPVEVSFLDFNDVIKQDLSAYQVIINAGQASTAWSGGDRWNNHDVEEAITRFVYNGGVFLGVNEPSATSEGDTVFKMASVLGVDEDTAARVCHGKWEFTETRIPNLMPEGCYIKKKASVHLTDGKAQVLASENGTPTFTIHDFGKGKGVYLSSFETTLENNRLLLNLLLSLTGNTNSDFITDNPATECAYFPSKKQLIVINNSNLIQSTNIRTPLGTKAFKDLPAYSTLITTLE